MTAAAQVAGPVEVICGREIHPVAAAFALLADADLQALADDIEARGLIHAIKTDRRGIVLDGRNRLRGCEIAGVTPRFEVVEIGDDEVAEYVLSSNLARRHMTTAERAMAGARLVLHLRAAGTGTGTRRAETVAARLRVSSRTIDDAITIIQKGVPALVTLTEAGDVAPTAAVVLARAKKPTQLAICAAGPQAVKKFASDSRRARRSRVPMDGAAAPIEGPGGEDQALLPASVLPEEQAPVAPPDEPASSAVLAQPSPPEVRASTTSLDVSEVTDEPELIDMFEADPPDGFEGWNASRHWLRVRVEMDAGRANRLRKQLRRSDIAEAILEQLEASAEA